MSESSETATGSSLRLIASHNRFWHNTGDSLGRLRCQLRWHVCGSVKKIKIRANILETQAKKGAFDCLQNVHLLMKP
jgi:hypothetical protein